MLVAITKHVISGGNREASSFGWQSYHEEMINFCYRWPKTGKRDTRGPMGSLSLLRAGSR